VGRKSGITEDQLHDLLQFDSSLHFNAREKAVLHLAVALTRTPADVSDELYSMLRQHFSEPELVELSAVITWENARARFNRVFAIPADNFSQGQFCPMPENAATHQHAAS